MLVTADLAGQVLVTPYNRRNKRHRYQTARGLAVVVPGQRFSVEVANLSDEPVCLRKGAVIASVRAVNDFDCLLVTDMRHRPPQPQRRRSTKSISPAYPIGCSQMSRHSSASMHICWTGRSGPSTPPSTVSRFNPGPNRYGSNRDARATTPVT